MPGGRKKSTKKRKESKKSSGYVIPPLTPVKTRSKTDKPKEGELVAAKPASADSVPPPVRTASSVKVTHNQSQRFQNQIVNFLFSIQMCSMNPTLCTVEI